MPEERRDNEKVIPIGRHRVFAGSTDYPHVVQEPFDFAF